ncbi:transcription repressor OFP14-like [Nymphaea colorata]|nr:transcription repressor OFP14-like [Nymphaea colorata]
MRQSKKIKMPNALHKALHEYFFKARRATRSSTENSVAAATSSSSRSSATSWLFSACRFPKTASFATDREVEAPAGIHHFNTLFLADDSGHLPEFTSISCSRSSDFSTTDSGCVPHDLTSSGRFLIVPEAPNSTFGVSNGLPAAPAITETETRLVGHSVAVTTYSPDPFQDFRQSMKEMVEARAHEQGVDWDFLEELLFCYLKLNHSRDHRYILAAFADLLVSLGTDQLPASLRPVRLQDTPVQSVNGQKARRKSTGMRENPAKV